MDHSAHPFLELGSARHALDLAGIRSVEELAGLTDVDLLRITGFRRHDVRRVEAFLERHGHRLRRREDRSAECPARDLGRRATDHAMRSQKPSSSRR
jgi:hypothetical protein